MGNERWDRLQEVFHGAGALAAAERDSFLERQCAGDAELLSEMRAMFAAGEFLDPIDTGDLVAMATGPEDSSEELPGRRLFGPYRLIRALGEGGMGKVYLAERTDVGSLVAIKLLRDAWISASRRERFADEQRIVAQLRHPRIASLYDAGVTEDGTPYFVMEYVDGVPITHYCADRRCSLRERLRLFCQVCEAVAYSHSQAIVHRDLKPSNILVGTAGDVKLLDFSIAMQMEAEGSDAHSQTRLRSLTPAYASPEQWRGQRPGLPSDIYSLGVVLYELLSGATPFGLAGVQPPEAERMVTQETPPAPSTRDRKTSGVPNLAGRAEWADLDVLCLKALRKEPAQRYATVDELRRDVQAFLDGRPLEARPDSWSYRGGKFLRRKANAAIPAAAAFLLVAATVIWYTARLASARNVAQAEAARSRRIQQFTLGLFKSGGTIADAPANLTVKNLADRGARDLERLHEEPELQAELFEDLGQIYMDIGELAEANTQFRNALAIRATLRGAPIAPEIEDRIKLMRVLASPEAAQESERLAREAIRIAARSSKADPAIEARANYALACFLKFAGRDAEAESLLDNIESVQQSSSNLKSDLLDTLVTHEITALHRGHYETCDRLNHRILAMESALPENDRSHTLSALQDLGTTSYIRGDFVAAEKYQREGLQVAQAWFGKDHRATANQMISLANVLTDEKKLTEAGPLLHEGLAIEERVYPPDSPFLGKAWHYLGRFQAASGDYASAARSMGRAESIFRRRRGLADFLLGLVGLSRGEMYLSAKNLPDAERSFRRALTLVLGARGEGDIYVALARVNLGHTLLLEGRYIEARQQSDIGAEDLKRIPGVSANFTSAAVRDLLAEDAALRRVALTEIIPMPTLGLVHDATMK